ncbi:YjcZ family sporulation protein [Bacillus sp. Marseille-Q1617]|nr:YjcZ family sporulation protein [Bacillus sp. Marseille-Q1617]
MYKGAVEPTHTQCYPGYGYPVAGAYNSFALIVVLFILLIIIGAVCYCK